MTKEQRVYAVEVGTFTDKDGCDLPCDEQDDETFMAEAEKQGTVWTVAGFIMELNLDHFDSDNYWIKLI